MTSHETNGRIKLSWAQFAWLLSMLVAIGAAWYDMREQVAAVRGEIAAMRVELSLRVQNADQEHAVFDRRIDRLEGRLAAPSPSD